MQQTKFNFLKGILIAGLFFLVNQNLNAQCVIISGASSSAVNGQYDTVIGQAYYRMGATNYYITRNSFKNNAWVIRSGTTKRQGSLYRSSADAATPDLVGAWQATINNSSSTNSPSSYTCPPDDSCILSSSLDTVCHGLPITLSLIGTLNLGSDWYWYQDDFNSTSIGSGSSLIVYPPNNNTTYYCRAENSGTSFVADSSYISIYIKQTGGIPTISGCGNTNDTVNIITDSFPNTTYGWKTDIQPYVWEALANSTGFTVGRALSLTSAFDTAGALYVAFQDSANSYKATVMKYTGGSWTTIGNAGFTPGSCSLLNLDLDEAGTPYVAFRDGNNLSEASVMKYDGSNWVYVGTGGFSANNSTEVDLVIGNDDTLYVAYNQSSGIAVRKFNGTSWVLIGSVGFNSSTAFDLKLALDSDNVPYVVFRDFAQSGKTSVMTYNGTSWVNLGSAGFSNVAVVMTEIALNHNDEVYVAYSSSSDQQISVMKYNGSSWTDVGSSDFTGTSTLRFCLAFDQDSLPCISYYDDTNIDVMRFDGDDWIPAGNMAFADSVVNYISMNIDDDNTLYVAYSDYAQSQKATIMKLVDPLSKTSSIQATDTSLTYYLTAIYDNGCRVYSNPTKASETEPVALPIHNGSTVTYQSNAIYSEGSWLHYCDCDNGYRLLSLDTNGSGAIVHEDSVELRVGGHEVFASTSSGGMVTNNKGYIMMDRRWNVKPTKQPDIGSDVGVKYYFTEKEWVAVQDSLATHNAGLPAWLSILFSPSDLSMFKATHNIGGGKPTAFADPHTVEGIVINSGATPANNKWVQNEHSFNYYAEFLVDSFSGGGGGGGGGGGAGPAALPVELLDFTATALNNTTVSLKWLTGLELNNSHFIVERSYNGEDFEVVGRVEGNGNSSDINSYELEDHNIAKGTKVVYYRLHQFDFNGENDYSYIARVVFNNQLNESEIKVFPNPVNSQLFVDFSTTALTEVEVKVTDLSGRVLIIENINANNLNAIDLSHLNPGSYIVTVKGEDVKQQIRILKI